MPVEKKGRGSKVTCVLVCEECQARSKAYRPTSPAAPELTACEQAEKDGWGYTIGFLAMLAGHRVLCPNCAGNWRATYVLDGERYDVVRMDVHPELGNRRRWEMRRAGVPGLPLGKVFLSDEGNRESALEEAARRLLGPEAVREAMS